MKTARLFLGVVLSSCVLFSAACTGNDSKSECKEDGFKCEKSGTMVVVCCLGSQCEYQVDGEVFGCYDQAGKLGTDCQSASEKVVEHCKVH
jgi:hypothetical protein